MSMSIFTIIIFALLAFWRGFASGADIRAKEMLIAHGIPVEATWTEWVFEKLFGGVFWIGENFETIIGYAIGAVVLFFVGSVVFQLIF